MTGVSERPWAVSLGQPSGETAAGLLITAFISLVGHEVRGDVVRCLADGIDHEVIHTAEALTSS